MGCSGARQASAVVKNAETSKGFHYSYRLVRKLGQGSQGSVYLAQLKSQGNVELAVKATDLGPDSDQVVRMEVEILRTLCNEKHCAQLVDFFLEGDVSYIVMEKCDSSLPNALEGVDELTVPVISSCIRQMLQGLAHVHISGIVHRDIKPDNFLVNGAVGRHHIVKLSDFGLAAGLPGGPAGDALLWGVCGTTPFCAPEMLTCAGYGTRVDMWSCGVVVYLLLLGHFVYMPRPFSLQNIAISIQEDRPKPSFKPRAGLSGAHITPCMISFLQLMLQRDPSERASAHKAMKHDWLRNRRSSVGTLLGHNAHSSEVAFKALRLPQVCLKPMLNSAEKLGAFKSDNRASNVNSFDEHMFRLSER